MGTEGVRYRENGPAPPGPMSPIRGSNALRGLASACRLAAFPLAVIRVAMLAGNVAFVGSSLSLIGGAVALVSDAVTLVGQPFPPCQKEDALTDIEGVDLYAYPIC